MGPDRSPTRTSLLNAVRDAKNAAAWAEFNQIYRPLLFSYIKKRGLRDEDVEEIVQTAFIKLLHEMPKFQLDHSKGRFRTWLFKLSFGLMVDWTRKKKTRQTAEEAYKLDVPGFDEGMEEELERSWDSDYQRHLLSVFMERVRPSVKPSTWACFEQHILGERPAKEVAAELNLTENSVYVNAKRVLDKLRELATAELGEEPF
jgi:RNA polymerase sigma-70 factor (ECF subfamily)